MSFKSMLVGVALAILVLYLTGIAIGLVIEWRDIQQNSKKGEAEGGKYGKYD